MIRKNTVAIIMKTIAVLLSTLALATATIVWDGLVTTWRLPSTDPERSNSFFSIPITRREAVPAGWVNACVKQSLKVDTYCLPDDSRFCVLFDKCGTLVGVQPSFVVSDFENVQGSYNMSRINYFQIKKMFNKRVWTSVAWIKNPANLKSGGCCEPQKNLDGSEGIWIETTKGYVKVPRNLKNLDSVWTEQACISTMGTHYYYDMRNTTACQDLVPWFLMYRNGSLSGIGNQIFGNSSLKRRSWNDVVPIPEGIKVGVPRGPQCLYDLPVEYGLSSIHIYLTKEPWTYRCT